MKNIELEHALEMLLQHIDPITEIEDVHLLEAHGRIIGEDIIAPLSQPPFNRSPLDGYAVVGEDTEDATKEQPKKLRVVAEVLAGDYSQRILRSGEAIRIMTGAPMPEGSNAVIRQEDTDEGEETVAIYKGVKPYSNFCYVGEDYKIGDALLYKGQILSAYHIGLLASAGMEKVKVIRKPRIGLLSTGDELKDPGEKLTPGKIYNSNLYTLGVRLKELGCEPLILGTTGDDVNTTIKLIKKYMDEVDMFLTTGGVSVGKKDIMHPVVEGLRAKRLFWRLKLKPGTPALASAYHGKVILSLSGNPSAACITFELLFRDLLAALMSSRELENQVIKATLTGDFIKKSPNRRFLRAHYHKGQVHLITKKHASGVLGSMIGCNCLVDIPAGSEGISNGETVKIHVYK